MQTSSNMQQLAPANDSNEMPMLNSGLLQYYMNGMEANVEENIAKLSGEIRDMSFWKIKSAILTQFYFIFLTFFRISNRLPTKNKQKKIFNRLF